MKPVEIPSHRVLRVADRWARLTRTAVNFEQAQDLYECILSRWSKRGWGRNTEAILRAQCLSLPTTYWQSRKYPDVWGQLQIAQLHPVPVEVGATWVGIANWHCEIKRKHLYSYWNYESMLLQWPNASKLARSYYLLPDGKKDVFCVICGMRCYFKVQHQNGIVSDRMNYTYTKGGTVCKHHSCQWLAEQFKSVIKKPTGANSPIFYILKEVAKNGYEKIAAKNGADKRGFEIEVVRHIGRLRGRSHRFDHSENNYKNSRQPD